MPMSNWCADLLWLMKYRFMCSALILQDMLLHTKFLYKSQHANCATGGSKDCAWSVAVKSLRWLNICMILYTRYCLTCHVEQDYRGCKTFYHCVMIHMLFVHYCFSTAKKSRILFKIWVFLIAMILLIYPIN